MSDDEEVQYVKKPQTIFYGSLEDSERTRLAAEAASGDNSNDGEPPQVNSTQIHISNGTQNTTKTTIILTLLV